MKTSASLSSLLHTPQMNHLYWRSIENRRKFLQDISIQLDLKTPSDWGNVTLRQFNEFGGSGILKYYDGSLFSCLQSVYQDVNWKREWFQKLPNSFWNSMENRKNVLNEIATKLNIKTPSDWGKITIEQIFRLGGRSLLSQYKNSLFNCLQSIYRDVDWKPEWFLHLQVPNSHWNSIDNCRKFLHETALKFNIKTPSDWGKVTVEQFRKAGGSGILYHYSGSLFNCLQSVYKDVKWKKEWFLNCSKVPNSYWKSMENRRNFLNEAASVLGIKTPRDWGKITHRQLREVGGSAILNYYYGSLFDCLRSVYKDIEWKKEWFLHTIKVPNSHWKSMENRKIFLDEVSSKLNLEKPSEWGKVTLHQFRELGGSGILNYYKGSLLDCLRSVYKDIDWKRKWFFNLSQANKTNWNSIENVRTFMDNIVVSSNIASTNDWKKVSLSLIRTSGGHGLLRKYKGSLQSILETVYSIQDTSELAIPRPASERILKESLKTIFSETQVFSAIKSARILNAILQ